MIAQVRGEVLRVGLDRVVVLVGGVGVLVHTTPATAAACRHGARVDLATHLVVREDALTLYGFDSDAERELFETVQTVSGIGPRIALAVLSVLSPDQVRAAITSGDLVTLTKVPGIGRKSAERLVLELRDRIGMPSAAAAAASPAPAGQPWREQVADALVGLGWTAKQAGEAVDTVAPAPGEPVEISAILRAALRELGR
jgi:Holliday junction DNA helicase RuvA